MWDDDDDDRPWWNNETYMQYTLNKHAVKYKIIELHAKNINSNKFYFTSKFPKNNFLPVLDKSSP